MSIAEKIYETVKDLPEQQAGEVLSFAEGLRARQETERRERREKALATLARYRGRFKADTFNREECYDRPPVR